jgi:GNAT superfamily N-acetyltransferase
VEVSIRPPRGPEWQAVRMLLPEAFRQPPTPEAELAFVDEDRALCGAAAYLLLEDALMVRQLQVVQPRRRQGMGTALIARLAAIAAERSLRVVRAHVNTLAFPEAQPFLIANGFAEHGCLWAARVEFASALKVLSPLRDRLIASGRVPEAVRVVHPAEAALQEVAALCAEHMESEWSVHPAYFRTAVFADIHRYSFVLMAGERVAGCLITEGAPGVEESRIMAHVVAPEFRRGWANTVLLATALERSASAGVRRVRFEALDDNVDTLNWIRRLGGEMVGATKRFERLVEG